MELLYINTKLQFVALLILLSFYAIYLGKMILQRKRGIKTDQMARGKKSKKLFLTELFLKIATYTLLLIEVVSIILNTTHNSQILKIMGVILGVIGVIIFGIAVCVSGR